MKVAIYNDAYLPQQQHFGTELVMRTYEQQLDRVGIELVGTVKYTQRKDLSVLDKADLVIVNGEGSFHHNRRNDLADISKRYPSVLINTVFDDNDVDLSNFLYIAARESMSASQIINKGVTAEVVPDITFSSDVLAKTERPRGRGIGAIRHTRSVEGICTMHQSAEQFLAAMQRYASFVTESFHGIVVCAVLGVPFRAYGGAGRTHKNKAMCIDLEYPEAYSESGPPVDVDAEVFVAQARHSIDKMFEGLHEAHRSC